MNKRNKIILAIMCGIEAVFYIISPILIVLIWIGLSGFNYWGDYILFAVGLISSVFRGIKIGWLKK